MNQHDFSYLYVGVTGNFSCVEKDVDLHLCLFRQKSLKTKCCLQVENFFLLGKQHIVRQEVMSFGLILFSFF